MAKKAHGLGRGLDSLFGEEELQEGQSIQEIDIGKLDPNPDQPRQTFDDETIAQLAESIREQGVIQPLIVVENGNRYRIIAGERRYRASRMVGLDTIPCIVKDIDIMTQMEISLIENLQREDLNAIEAAQGIKALMQQCGYTQEKVSARLGKSRPAVANLLRLLSLPDEVTAMVKDGTLSAGHARVLAGLSGKEKQITLAKKTVEEGLSVRQLENLVAAQKKAKKKPVAKTLPPELSEMRERLLGVTGMKTTMTGTLQKGKIVMQYGSQDELERLWDLLGLGE